jgi:CRISPR-associated protein Csd1
MILQALTDYYDRRRRQEDDDRPPPFGYASERVGFVLVLDEQGRVVRPIPLGDTDDKGQRQPRVLEVPRPLGGRTSGIRAYFLCDKTQYVLGAGGDKPARDREAFEASKDKHLRYLADSDDPGAVAVRRFFETWDPTQAETLEHWPEMAGANLVFRLDGQPGYIHESPALQAIWQDRFAEENEAEERQCLVTGEDGPAAMLHPPVKGVRGAQSSGAYLVSFNAEAFCSYGQGVAGKGLNAPVSQRAAFAYTTALNELLRWDSPRRLQLGETSVVFWAADDTPYEEVLPAMFAGRDDDSGLDPDTAGRVRKVLETIEKGRKPEDTLDNFDPSVRFYILGLAAPSQARLTVRFWLVTTLGHLLGGIRQHYEDLRLQTRFTNEREMPPLWRLVAETAQDRDLNNALPQLHSGMLHAVLTGAPYPRAVLGAVLGRIRVESGKASRGAAHDPITHPRAALIKASLIRRAGKDIPTEVEKMSLDTETPDVAYRLGRLFAVMEKAQHDAQGKNLKRTIRDGYFASASAAPQAVFPRLLRLTQHHISKADYGYKSDKAIEDVVNELKPETAFPSRLDLEEQGRFVLGYYHQRNAFYSGRDRQEPAPADGPDNTPALEEETV